MNPHYSIVLVNLLITSGVAVALLLWIKVFKQKISPFWLLIIISFLPLTSLFRAGVAESGDMALHATRAMSFYESLVELHGLPRWAGELNLGYGDTFFEFLYVTPYLLISLFHAIGFSFITGIKLVFASTYVASGIFMYLWIKNLYGKKAGFISAIFYLFAPYHLVDMHFRGTVAESAAFLFLPLLPYLISQYFQTLQKKFLVLLSISYAFFLLTHAVIFLAFTPFLFIYTLLVWKSKKNQGWKELVLSGTSLISGVLLTTFYWLPILGESTYIYQSLEHAIEFHPMWEYLVSPWRYGFLFQGHRGELSFIVGYTQLAVVILAAYFLLKRKFKRSERSFVITCLLTTAVLFCMMLSFSYPVWRLIPLIKNFQFSYRLLELIVFYIAAISGVVLLKIKNSTIIILICVVTIFYTALNWSTRAMLPGITDATLKNQLLTGPTVTGWFEPTTPIWVNRDDASLLVRPEEPIQIVSGSATVDVRTHTSTLHEYQIIASTPSFMRENTFYFPGWHVYVDGKQAELEYDTAKYSGVIHFSVPEGKHMVRVRFEDSPVRALADKISLIGISTFAVFLSIFYARSRPIIKRSQS